MLSLVFWQNRIRDNELDHLIVGAAEHKVFQKNTHNQSPLRGPRTRVISGYNKHTQQSLKTFVGKTHNEFHHLLYNNFSKTTSWTWTSPPTPTRTSTRNASSDRDGASGRTLLYRQPLGLMNRPMNLWAHCQRHHRGGMATGMENHEYL